MGLSAILRFHLLPSNPSCGCHVNSLSLPLGGPFLKKYWLWGGLAKQNHEGPALASQDSLHSVICGHPTPVHLSQVVEEAVGTMKSPPFKNPQPLDPPLLAQPHFPRNLRHEV